MFLLVIKNEFRNMLRDKMYIFFALLTVILAIAGFYLVDYLNAQFPLFPLAAHMATLLIVVMEGYIFGAITGFTIMDDRDDAVLFSLKVSPINVRVYIIIKLMIAYLFGVLATYFVIIANPAFKESSFISILFISLLSPFQGPVIALLINALATNKVEGFVIMKMTGLLLMIPIAVFYISNWTEVFLMIIPGFWVSRLIAMELVPGSGFLNSPLWYAGLGFLINGLLLVVLFKWFVKRVNI